MCQLWVLEVDYAWHRGRMFRLVLSPTRVITLTLRIRVFLDLFVAISMRSYMLLRRVEVLREKNRG
ncbi:hypothetical protein EPI10_024166 [Gossypium australe]|uniref:Uncharacterized protein n=1 Tax=Gossypium australe TaxID=47621 RepID=A0A5B6VXS4_9ROSI|nr:hypothetical protein EPI10_024166 [Gossypium australe]